MGEGVACIKRQERLKGSEDVDARVVGEAGYTEHELEAICGEATTRGCTR